MPVTKNEWIDFDPFAQEHDLRKPVAFEESSFEVGDKIMRGTIVGPASYATGGIPVDLSDKFSELKIVIPVPSGGRVIEIDETNFAAGTCLMKAMVCSGGANDELVEEDNATNLSTFTFPFLAIGTPA